MTTANLEILLNATPVRSLAAVGTLPGVVVSDVAGRNGPGEGRLRSAGDGTLLAWRAPGSVAYGAAVACAADGSYRLTDGEDRDKWVEVDVYRAYLVPGPAEEAVTLGDVLNNAIGGADVSAADAAAGRSDTVELTLRANADLHRVRAWLADDTTGLELSADEGTWSSPTTADTAVALGDLNEAQTRSLFLRRTIAPGAIPGVVLNRVCLSCERAT